MRVFQYEMSLSEAQYGHFAINFYVSKISNQRLIVLSKHFFKIMNIRAAFAEVFIVDNTLL